MMRRTYQQRRWPETPLFQSIAERWCENQSRRLLDLVWRAIDDLRQNDLDKVPVDWDDEAKEESLNFLLSVRIDRLKTGDEPFCVSHQPPEQSKRKTKNSRSPAPDIGFVWYENQNCIWPIEGKMLKDANDLDAYESEITGNLVSGRYATFSTEGAMLGYLLSGKTADVLVSLAERIGTGLEAHSHFPERDHRVSKHERQPIADRHDEFFLCHHLSVAVY